MTQYEVQIVEPRERRLAWDVLRNSATGRMAAALGSRLWPFQLVGTLSRLDRGRDDAVEPDRRYFRRRSEQERLAANAAAGMRARAAHAELAELYAGLARSSAASLGAAPNKLAPRRADDARADAFTKKHLPITACGPRTTLSN